MDNAKYNIGTRIDGKYAMLSLSGKAAEYYLGTDPLTVFEYGNEEKRYAYSYAENPYTDKEMVSDLTFEELQEAFEKMQAEKEKNNNGGLDMDKRTDTEKMQPDGFLTGEHIRTPRGSFSLTSMTVEQMKEAGYGLHHESDDGKYLIMGNGTQAFAVAAVPPEKQPEKKELTALLTIIQGDMTKYINMGDMSMDDIFRQLKKSALPFIEIKGDVIYDGGRFAALEQSGRVSVSVTADIDNDRLTVYEINGVPEDDRTKENTRIWTREKMSNFLKERVREPKSDNSQHSPYHGVGRSHASEHEHLM